MRRTTPTAWLEGCAWMGARTLALFLSTAVVAMADRPRAIQHATRACELTGWQEPGFVATLASAYAEAGRFAEAVATQKRYLAFVLADARRATGQERMALYEQGEPYHAPFPAPDAPAAST